MVSYNGGAIVQIFINGVLVGTTEPYECDPYRSLSIDKLKEVEQQAVLLENYEEAAYIRDYIKKKREEDKHGEGGFNP